MHSEVISREITALSPKSTLKSGQMSVGESLFSGVDGSNLSFSEAHSIFFPCHP